MKRIISFMLAVVLTMSLVGCGEIEQVGVNDSNNSQSEINLSPEVNVKDEFYTKALSFCPRMIAGWTLDAMGIYDSIEDYHWLYKFETFTKGISEKYEYGLVVKPKEKLTMDDYFAQFNAEKPANEWTENTIPESIKNRRAWEEKNQFFFCPQMSAYKGSLSTRYNEYYLKDNTLSVIYYDYDTSGVEGYVDENGTPYNTDTAKRTAHGYAHFNPYYSFDKVDENGAKIATGLNGKYNYETASKNYDAEVEKLIDTAKKYLEQKYLGKDNGIEFSDYMLKYATFEDVEKFVKSQKLKKVEIKDIVTHTSLISFHPFVDVEYTLVANGEETKIHEIFFFEIDKENGEFVYKIAYVANFSISGEPTHVNNVKAGYMYDYNLFRGGVYASDELNEEEKYFKVGEPMEYNEICYEYNTPAFGELYWVKPTLEW